MRLSRLGQQHSRTLYRYYAFISPSQLAFLLVDCCVAGRLSSATPVCFWIFSRIELPPRTNPPTLVPSRKLVLLSSTSSLFFLNLITRHGSLKPNASCRPGHGYGHGKCCSWWCKCTLVASLSLRLSWMPLSWFLGGGQRVKLVYPLDGALNLSPKKEGN